MRYRTLCRLVALAILVSLALRWPVFRPAGGLGIDGTTDIAAVLPPAILVLGLASAAGLWRGRPWGFFAFYAFAIAATIVLGVSLIPYLPSILPAALRAAGVLLVNGILLVLVALLHRESPR